MKSCKDPHGVQNRLYNASHIKTGVAAPAAHTHTHRRGTFHRRRYSLDAKKPLCFALLHPPQHKSHARVALPFQCAFSAAQVPCNSRAARPMRSATAHCRTPIEEPITCQNNPSSLARASLQDKTQCFALRHPPQTQVPCIFDV